MADAKLKIVIDAVNNAKKELSDLGKQLEGVKAPTEKADNGLRGMMNTLKAVGIVAGAMKLGKMAFELGDLAAATMKTERVLTSMSGSAASAKDNLDAMLRATEGEVSRADALTAATQMLQMGLADTAEELENNARLAVKLGEAMGVDAASAMSNWNTMMNTQSSRYLKNFGINVQEAERRMKELKAATKDLSDEEAFQITVMELAGEAMGRLGDDTNDLADAQDRARAATEDLKVELGKELVASTVGATTVIGKFTRMWGDNLRMIRESHGEINKLQANYDMLFEVLGAGTTVFDRYRQKQEQIEKLTALSTTTTTRYADTQRALMMAHVGNGESMEGLMQVGQEYEAWLADRTAEEAYIRTQQELADQTARTTAALDAEASQLGELSTDAFAGYVIAQAEATMGAEDFAVAQRAILEEFDLLTAAELGASAAIGRMNGHFLSGKATAAEYAAELRNIKAGLDGLYDKEITVRVKYNEGELKGPGGTGVDASPDTPYVPPVPPNVGGSPASAVGGVSGGGWTMVGERGPELVNLPGGSHVMSHPVTNNVTNNYNLHMNTRATSGTVRQDFALLRALG